MPADAVPRVLTAETATVRPAALTDLAYVDDQRRRESECIGFISRSAYESVITGYDEREGCRRNGRIWLAEVNGERVGFVHASPGAAGRSTRVIQVCIQEDARRIEYGSALVAEVERWATQLQRPAVGCHVATDIEAGAFWDALGYELRGQLPGGTRRGRVLEDRYRVLPCGLFLTTPPRRGGASSGERP